MSLNTGDVIDGKYRIVRLLGEGGMGAVFEGENTRIHRRVAIKVLHKSVAGQEDVVQRFEREAQAAGRIGSEHIVEVLDLGDLPNGDRYMVMEFMDGESLSERIEKTGRLDPVDIVPIAEQLLEALGAAHGAGIIHRDLKPDNIYLLKQQAGRKDFLKILDFGISKFSPLSGESGLSMTRTGSVMGTPYYMAPEQAKGGKDLDHRADLYSAGVLLYECATGVVPFNAETFNELLFKIVLESPPPVEERVPGIDLDFAAIVRKSMERDADDRYATAEEFRAAILKWAETGRASAAAPAPKAKATEIAPKLAGTQGAWAKTGAPRSGRNRTGLVIGAVGGVALLAVVFSGGDEENGAATAAAGGAPVAAPSLAAGGEAPEPGADAKAKADADAKAKAEAAAKAQAEAAADAKAQAESAADAKAQAEAAAKAQAEADAKAATEKAAAKRKRRRAPRVVKTTSTAVRTETKKKTPAPVVVAPKKSAKTPAPKTSPGVAPAIGKSGNRKIRTDL